MHSDVNVIRLGHGPMPALLMHCSLGHSGGWAGVMNRLGDRLSAIAFDLPSHGRSAAWDGRGDYQSRATEIAAGLLDQPMHLVGHSFGAVVALRLALEQPEKVLSLVLAEPVLFAALRGTALHSAYRASHAEFEALLNAGNYAGAAREFLRHWGDGTPWEELPQDFRDQVARQIFIIRASGPAIEEDAHGLLAPGRLEACDVPVLMLAGAESPSVIASVQDVLAARLPDARRVTISGAGHMLPITHPVQVGDAIAAFLDEPALRPSGKTLSRPGAGAPLP